MLTTSTGYSVDYLTGAVAAGRENYYTGAVAAGEPPGRWSGRGAEALGLTGLVDTQDMTALYEHFIDPRSEEFTDPEAWAEAPTLGHTGRAYATEEQVYAAALQREPDASPERRAELWVEAGKRARKNVAFLDATFSVQKSVTVLHTAFEAQQVAARTAAVRAAEDEAAALAAGDTAAAREAAVRRTDAEGAEAAWDAHRTAVEDAIWVGNQAALGYLSDRAGYSRVGHHGGAAGRYVDAHDWTIASFFQHDSRDHDPQLHIHNAILNRVQGTDGAWRTLDSRAIHKYRGAAAAVGERTTEEHLARALGIQFAARPDGKAREVVGIEQKVMDLFSSRRRAITAKTRQLVSTFEAKFDRAPNSLELDRLQRQATFATRKAKSHEGETTEARLERWNRELRTEVAGGLGQVAATVLETAGKAPEAERWTRSGVIEAALADVQTKKAAWTAADLTRAVSDALPARLGDLNAAQVTQLLDGLTAEALQLAVPLDADRPAAGVLPDELRLADGRSAYDAPGGALYATPEHIHTERLLAAAAAGGAPALDATRLGWFTDSLTESGIELGADQAAAVQGILTSGADVETLVGPAGTGKSFVVGMVAKAWQDPALWDGTERRVIGLASSQIATEVLSGEGLHARNVTRWLASQQRLDDGRPIRDDQAWQLSAGDLVVVDESAMTGTGDLAEIRRRASEAGAKVLLTGDHRQLAAVEAAGGMELVAATAPTYELAEARRFTEEWERAASLRLREADPSVLGDYHKHGRLVDAGAVEQAEASAARGWLADTLAGQHSLLVVDTNEQAARLSAQLRADLVRLGLVAEQGVPLGLQGTFAGSGDLVQARLNGWNLAKIDGNKRGPINREQYRVLSTRTDGGLVVAPIIGRSDKGEQLGAQMTLPGSYVTEHVALGYAATVHAVQGLTVDTAHSVTTPATGHRALYVSLTRGRGRNTAHVATRTAPADAPTGATNDAVQRSALAVVAGCLDAADPEQSALATATESTAEAESVRTPAELLADAIELATAGRVSRWLDQLVDAGHLTAQQRVDLAAEDGASSLTRVLRRAELAGHSPQEVLTEAVTGRTLSGSRQITNVIHHRISDSLPLDPIGDTYADWVPTVEDPAWQRYLASLAAAADTRREQLGAEVAETAPQWAIEALGPVPADAVDRAGWVERAGIVAAHRELTGHTDEAVAVGVAPKPGQAEAYASWRAAWRALGLPEADRDELEMSDGQLHVRIRAHQREAAWGPRYVANELAGTHQAAATHRQAAALRAAEAAAAADPVDRERLDREAAEAAQLAAMLDDRAEQLQQADDARSQWLAHTAGTRAASDRATAELSARRAKDGRTDEPITATEWLTEHDAAMAAEDEHRPITAEHDLAAVAEQRIRDLHALGTDPAAGLDDVVEVVEEPDLRQLAEAEPRQGDEDLVRVPTAEETAATIQRAQRALAEVERRHTVDRQRALDERDEQLARWHADDHLVDEPSDRRRYTDRAADHDDRGPVLEIRGPGD